MAEYTCINKVLFNEKHWYINERTNGILINSISFPGAVKYLIKGDSIILMSGIHGIFSFDLKHGPRFLDELGEIVNCYGRERDP